MRAWGRGRGERRIRRVGMGVTLAIAAAVACAHREGPRRPVTRESRAGEVAAAGAGRVARVAIALGAVQPTVGATGAWELYDEGSATVVARGAGSGLRIERRGDELRAVGQGTTTPWREGPLVVRPTNETSLATHAGKRWRGELWAHTASGGGVTIVNRVPVEEYLRGVVPLELNAFAPSDVAALEAQAVAARSYVYGRLPEFAPRDVAIRQAALPYDLRATTNDQVYGGVDVERAASDRAIATTAGLVLRFSGAVVSAPYYSACGGSSAEPVELWQSPGEPWLRRVSDRVPGTDRHYCDIAPRFRWERTWDEATLRGVLQRYLRATSGVRGAIGEVHDVTVESRTPSGRVGTLALDTDAGRATLRGNDIRFAVRTVGGDILPSTYFSVDTERDGSGHVTRVTIRGNGNGHGVGMCQWGAVGRARAGHDFRAILRAYYPGTTVESAE
jgi:stage II sporulation protein D